MLEGNLDWSRQRGCALVKQDTEQCSHLLAEWYGWYQQVYYYTNARSEVG